MEALLNSTEIGLLGDLGPAISVALMLTPGLYMLRAFGEVTQWQAAGAKTDGVRFMTLSPPVRDLDPWANRLRVARREIMLAALSVSNNQSLTLDVWSTTGTAEVGVVRLGAVPGSVVDRASVPHVTFTAVGFSGQGCRMPDWTGRHSFSSTAQPGATWNLMSALRVNFAGDAPTPTPSYVHLMTPALPAKHFYYKALEGCQDLFTGEHLSGPAAFVVYTDKRFRIGGMTLNLRPGYYLAYRPVVKSVFDLAFCSPEVDGDEKRNWGWTPTDYGRWSAKFESFVENHSYDGRAALIETVAPPLPEPIEPASRPNGRPETTTSSERSASRSDA